MGFEVTKTRNNMPLGALIAGGSSLLSTIGNLWNAKRNRDQSVANQQRTIQANKEQAKYAYSKELEMWNRANTYNSPASQMQRFTDAGLNPNLMYGRGQPGLAAQSMPKYNAPRIDYNEKALQLPKLDMYAQYQNMRMQTAQIDNVRKQAKLAEQNTNLKGVEMLLKGAQTAGLMHDNKRKEAMANYAVELAELTVDKQRADIDKIIQQKANLISQEDLNRITITSKELQNTYQEYKNELADFGIYEADNPTLRLMVRVAKAENKTFKEIVDMLKEEGKTIWDKWPFEGYFQPGKEQRGGKRLFEY